MAERFGAEHAAWSASCAGLVAKSATPFGLDAYTPEHLAAALPGYVLEGEIHRGGQGVVYRAVQRSTGRTVAIKVLHQGLFARRSDLARFQLEVQVLAQLDHPHLVGVLDCGVALGCAYVVMEL